MRGIDQKKHHLSFEEFNSIESGANGEAGCSLEEGYVFGLLEHTEDIRTFLAEHDGELKSKDKDDTSD